MLITCHIPFRENFPHYLFVFTFFPLYTSGRQHGVAERVWSSVSDQCVCLNSDSSTNCVKLGKSFKCSEFCSLICKLSVLIEQCRLSKDFSNFCSVEQQLGCVGQKPISPTQIFILHQPGAGFFFFNHKKMAGVGNQGIWATGIVAKFFQDSEREDRIFFPGPSLQIPKCITNYKALHVNTPFRAMIARFSSKVVDSTQKRMYAGQVGLCNLKLQ